MLNTTHLEYMSVVETTPASREIDQALRRLDDRLFLDPERDPDFDGRILWTVKYYQGDQPPTWICDWRDPYTREPLELSWGIYSMIARRENREPGTLMAEIRADNERMGAMRAERQYSDYEEVARDLIPRIKGAAHSAVLHRSVGLRQSRDRARARGRRV